MTLRAESSGDTTSCETSASLCSAPPRSSRRTCALSVPHAPAPRIQYTRNAPAPQGRSPHAVRAQNGPTGRTHEVFTFNFTRKDGVKIKNSTGKAVAYASREKWGIKTGMFHRVQAVTLSPNYWGTNVGNKHVFFLLEGCRTDERVRPFLNEFLKPELEKDRKVFELLGSKVEVEAAPDELSGLGF